MLSINFKLNNELYNLEEFNFYWLLVTLLGLLYRSMVHLFVLRSSETFKYMVAIHYNDSWLSH